MEEIKEVWKSLDFLGYPDYEVSNIGRVKSLKGKERILKYGKTKDGYLLVALSKNRNRKTFLVHRLVALAFILNPENLPCVNHKDENKENNHVDNLEFCTYSFNINYGTRNKKASKTMINGKLAKPILQFSLESEFIREWESINEIQRQLDISKGNISSCCNFKRKTCGGFIWRYKQ